MEVPQLEAIQTVLTKILGANTSYCYENDNEFNVFGLSGIGRAQHRLGILIVSDNDATSLPGQISQEIEAAFECEMPIALLLHKPKSLQTKSHDQRWFFDQVMRFGYRMTLDHKNPPYLNQTGFPQRDIPGARQYWDKCSALANQYFESAVSSERLDVELIKVAMLSTAMEFVALGLIRVFIGYTPNRHSLKFLFSITGAFTDIHEKIFEPHTEVGQRCLKRLYASPNMLRHWNELKMDESDYAFLESTCERYLTEATQLSLNELQRLETIKHSNS
ncbi:hypothetical protein [Flavobacterium selenitireducens]|uniref:hypothetical protein n=1 Tax=Flavobacterium selenitireducens TaxID=2722704 RepID=UPI00168B5BC7|nr:hypothetical protein [Flavobacterium selenitireducens]MBD3581742.1 hypothetical protein [Flavobacterium selenitireducens]